MHPPVWQRKNEIMFRRSETRRLPRSVRSRLEPYFPEVDLHSIRLREGIPWYVVMDADGYTDLDTVYFKPGKYDPDTVPGIALIGHEIAHCRQYQQHGRWGFRLRYIGSWLWHFLRTLSWAEAYQQIGFEVEARDIERTILRDLSRCSVKTRQRRSGSF